MSIYTYDRINLVDLSARIAGFANTLKNNDNNPNDKNKYNKDEKKTAICECTSYNGVLSFLLGELRVADGGIGILRKFPSGSVAVSSLKWLNKRLNPSDDEKDENAPYEKEEADKFKKEVMHKSWNLESSIIDAPVADGNQSGLMFLEDLMGEVDPIYFMDDEFKKLEERFKAEASQKSEDGKKHVVGYDDNFIGNLFLHAFKCMAYNLPYYVSRRIFHEALTLSSNNPMRLKLLRCAADNHNGYAALMYANEIYNDNAALDYFLIAGGFKEDTNGKPRQMPSQSNALWEIGFMLETHAIPESQIDYIERFIGIEARVEQQINSYKDKNIELINKYMYDGYKYTEVERDTILSYADKKSVKYALRLYIYITMTDLTFPKAFNSIGKIILGDYLDPKAKYPSQDIDPDRLATAKKYLKIAVRLGNTNAMVNLAVYYYRTSKYNKSGVSKLELDEMRKYFEKAAALEESEAQHCLGEILLTENRFDEACALLKTAADKNDRHACHSIGKAYISAMKTEEGERYLEKAISLRCYDAAYDLAWLYLVKKAIKDPDSKAVYIQYGIRLLQDNYPNMSDEYKAKSKDLLDGLGISI